MQELLLTLKQLRGVARGNKTSTIRKGRRDITLGPLLFKATEDVGTSLKVIVKAVTYKTLANLNTQDANRSDYDSDKELRDSLFAIYPDLEANTEMTIIEFYVQ